MEIAVDMICSIQSLGQVFDNAKQTRKHESIVLSTLTSGFDGTGIDPLHRQGNFGGVGGHRHLTNGELFSLTVYVFGAFK